MNKAIYNRNMGLLIILVFSILSFVFSFGIFNFNNAFAQNPNIPEVTVQNKTVHRGQTFSIDVELGQNTGLISLFLTLDYNHTVMTLKDVVQGSALGALKFTPTNAGTEQGYAIKPFNMLWDGKESDNSTGTLITLIFDSSVDAPVGEYPITLTYDKQNTNTAYETPIDISITNGVVNLITGEFEAIYRDYDGTILYQRDYNGDEIPSYPNTLPNPSREEDKEYSYEFIGFKGVISDNLNILIFEADYKLIPQVYLLRFFIDGINFDEDNNPTPDGIMDENTERFRKYDVAFGEVFYIPSVPENQLYEFNGWYTDAGFQNVLNFTKMPSRILNLYGYYSFDVREKNIPVISLNSEFVDDTEEDFVVTAELLINPGFNGLILTLQYDHDAFILDHFENLDILSTMDFDTTNIAYLNSENFKFYYESTDANNYEIGSFLKLYFKVKPNVSEKTYKIAFSYDYHSDATYLDANNKQKYTMVEFYDAEVPVGEINHWVEQIDNTDRIIDVTSQKGLPINVYLEIELVTKDINLEDDLIKNEVGSGMFVSSAYSIRLMQNRKEIQPNTTLTVKIKLTEKEQNGKIKFYYLNNNNELESKDFSIENGKLVFTTDHLSNWVIFCNNSGSINKSSILFNVGMPIILAIATMLYALRLKQRITKIKKEGHND